VGAAVTSEVAGSVPWSGVTGKPSGFGDNVDNDTTYTAGAGLTLSGTEFSIGGVDRLSASDGDPSNALYVDTGGFLYSDYSISLRGDSDPTPWDLRSVNTPFVRIAGSAITLQRSLKQPAPTIRFPTSASILSTSAAEIKLQGDGIAVSQNLFVPSMANGSGLAVYWNNGQLVKQTSSRRYKQEITRLEADFDQVLEIEPKRFKYKTDSVSWQIGYIAEELDAAGLKELVAYDSKGRPEAIDYAKIAIYSNELLKRQRALLEAQQERIEGLERSLKAIQEQLKRGQTTGTGGGL
jgi:hypothetical protein